jgi:hypothetical protein
MKTMVFAMGVVVVVIGLAGALWFGEIDARRVREEADGFSLYLQAQVEEMKMRERRLQDASFFTERGNTALSDRMDLKIPEFDPEDPFDVLPDELKRMLLDDGWRVILYDGKIDERGAGQVVGQMNPAEKIIELTEADPEQTTLVLYHEVGHIVASEIRTDLIRAGYTSRETLPDIVFHGGADTAYHEDQYEEYLANYLAESVFWGENAELAGEEFSRIYQNALQKLLTRNPAGTV